MNKLRILLAEDHETIRDGLNCCSTPSLTWKWSAKQTTGAPPCISLSNSYPT